MAKWQRTLDISDQFQAAKAKEITTQDLAKVVSSRLQNLKPLGNKQINAEKMEIAEEFDDIGTDSEASVECFDAAMERLYDWADTPLDPSWNGKKVCWVKTF